MRLQIDKAICTGHGLCYVHAPHVFTDDEHEQAESHIPKNRVSIPTFLASQMSRHTCAVSCADWRDRI
jgi:ferredoxin